MYWDAPNESQNPDDLFSVVQKHVEGMYPDDEEEWEDLTQELHDALYQAAEETVFQNPPDDPGDVTEQKCERIEDEFDEKADKFMSTLLGKLGPRHIPDRRLRYSFLWSQNNFAARPADHGIEKEVINKAGGQKWRELERKLEKMSDAQGLYQFENYHLYNDPGTMDGIVVLELKKCSLK